ncbi:hypothetical protein ACWGJX_46105 [Streptomyces sp. NPDC054775]
MSEDELLRRLEQLEGQVARIGELEAEVARLREDAASARALAGMADRDVAEMRTTMRGHAQVLNAIRETQIEHGQAITGIVQTLRGVGEAVGGLVVSNHQLQQTTAAILERLGGADGKPPAGDA